MKPDSKVPERSKEDAPAGLFKAAAILGTPADPDIQFAVDMDLQDSRERWEQKVMDWAVDIAIRNDAFRRRLAAKLADLGEGRRTRARANVQLEVQQAASVALLMAGAYGGTRLRHRTERRNVVSKIAEMLGVSQRQAERRYDEAKQRGLF